MDLIDLAALNHVVNRLALKGDLKFVASGLGWAFAELVAFRLMPFWLEARGSEFSWIHLMSAMEANVNLVRLLFRCVLRILRVYYSCSLFFYFCRYITSLLLRCCGHSLAVTSTRLFKLQLSACWYSALTSLLYSSE